MIAIINYKAGNLTSVERALSHLGIPCTITDNADEILSANRVIFPGVGAAGKAMETITSQGLDKVIKEVIARKTPFLGICLGTQIILDCSEEDNADCLGIIPGTVKRFRMTNLKIPHIGWNNITLIRSHFILKGIDLHAQFYFVHSYYPAPEQQRNIIATSFYGIEFASVMGSGNVVATQFHPEKSGRFGLQILKNFSQWDGSVNYA